MRLRDKIAIITGAGSGSGRAGAMVFNREGAKVVVGDIDTTAGEETTSISEMIQLFWHEKPETSDCS